MRTFKEDGQDPDRICIHFDPNRLIEMWLSTSLNLVKEFLTEDAMRIEPAASARLMEAIDAALGHPELD